nr:hypothetical protein B0A51_11764 [Rachicladosporium sp. CCFEE 5018]
MRIIISGAGIAGPTAAYFLAKAGRHIDVTVLEKAPRLLAHGQNVDIEDQAIDVIKKMGLMEQVRRYNTTEEGTQFISPKGRPFAPFPVTGAGGPTSELEILRGDLALITYEVTKVLPNVHFRFGTTIKRVFSSKQDGDELDRVELSDGETESFDALVAADGQWSKTRSMCFPQSAVSVVDMGVYAAYFTVPKTANDNKYWNLYQALDSKIIGTRPDPHGTTRAMFTCVPRNAAQKKSWEDIKRADRLTQEKHIAKEYSNLGWEAKRLVDAMPESPDFYFQSLQQIRMPYWHTSRVICMGDAAFCPTPLAGMGASLALMSAYYLAGEMSTLKDGEHPQRAFAAYESVFRPIVNSHLPDPSSGPKLLHPAGRVHRWVFQRLITVVAWIVGRMSPADKKNTAENRQPTLMPYAAFERMAIDGVLLRSSTPIPSARSALLHLHKLDIELDTSLLVQSHTPFAELTHLHSKTVLVAGGDGSKCADVARSYGFENVVTPGDILTAHPEIWPFARNFLDYYSSFARPLPSADPLKVDAIFVYNDPRDWGLDSTILLDLLLSSKGVLGTLSPKNGDASLPNNGYLQDSQPHLYYSNPDLWWASAHPLPRLGQGGFQHAFAGLWDKVTSGAELAHTLIGKPSQATYEFAERRLRAHRKTLFGAPGLNNPLRRVYMVGDNPESDIRGANAYDSPYGSQWRSLLVKTGVFSGSHGDEAPEYARPDALVQNVGEAVKWALSNSGWESKIEKE